jgi:hypothetical protein
MQQNLAHLINWTLDATDGEIGTVEDFYFDDQTWAVRYLAVKTGGWLSGRPDINTDKPISRQHEAELAVYYSWKSTWGPGFYPGAAWGVIPSTPVIDPSALNEADGITPAREDFHLRGAQQVGGYRIHANNGDIGHVVDFIFDDQNWQISHLLIDTHNWVGGEKGTHIIDKAENAERENNITQHY